MSLQLQQKSMTYAYICLTVGAMCIGFAPIFAKIAVQEGSISPIAAGFWRMFFGSLTLAIGWAGSVFRLPLSREYLKRSDFLFVLPGLFFAVDLSVWHWSFEYTSIANASILANVASIIVPIVSLVFFGERLRGKFFVGAVIAFFGLVVLIHSGHSNLLSGRSHSDQALGDGLAFLAAFMYSGYLISTKRYVNRFPTFIIMVLSSAWSAIILLVVVFVKGGVLFPKTFLGWVYAIALGIVAQALGQGLVARAMRNLSASVSSVTLLLAPLLSALYGVIILQQPLSLYQILAGGIVIGGIVYAGKHYSIRSK